MLTALLAFFTILVFWQFMGFPLFMALIYKKRKTCLPDKDYSYQPFISIIVPAYDEERVIKRRIENLLSQDYPRDKFEIVIVDSGSTDATLEIARGLEKNLKRKGRKLRVKIPAGVKTGSKVRLRNARQTTDGQPGDIIINIRVRQ